MKFDQYPVFLLRNGEDYATISTPESEPDKPEFGLLIFESQEMADDFVKRVELQNVEVVPLEQEELVKVWNRLIAPISKIAWNTKLDDEGNLTTSIYDSVE